MKAVFLKIIKFYQKYISSLLGSHCKFYPSCSEYCYLAINKYGSARGIWKGFKRILRCHPWGEGGIDQP